MATTTDLEWRAVAQEWRALALEQHAELLDLRELRDLIHHELTTNITTRPQEDQS